MFSMGIPNGTLSPLYQQQWKPWHRPRPRAFAQVWR